MITPNFLTSKFFANINNYVTSKINKACRAGGPAGIGQTGIKPAWHPLKQIPELAPADQTAVGPAHERDIRQAENDGNLAGLVLKYFADEITQALIEVQELLEREQNTTEKAGK
jgi:hypothetical protein